MGLACSERIGMIGKNEKKTIRFALDTSPLSTGTYRATFGIYIANENGESTTYDIGTNALHFKIVDLPNENRIIGIFEMGGFARLPDLKLL